MTNGRPGRPPLRIVAIVALLTGCTETGDFGRPRSSVWNDTALPFAGSLSAVARGELSGYALTNDETELRQRAWRFVMPAHERAVFDAALADLALNRVLPEAIRGEDPAVYHRAFRSEPYRSPTSRYRRLGQDIYADRALILPLRHVAGRVASADRTRRALLDRVSDLSINETDDAVARMAENVALTIWVRRALALRICRYRYALEHFVVEAPQAEAVPVERALAALAYEAAALDTLDVGPLSDNGGRREAAPWTRPSPGCASGAVLIDTRTRAQGPIVAKD